MTDIQHESLQLANQYAQPGTVKHFALRLGFMPHDEKEAEAILRSLIRKGEIVEDIERLMRQVNVSQ